MLIPTPAPFTFMGRRKSGDWARSRGLAIATALIVKHRDPGTDARVALEGALR